ncbi:winged helix-turn-helix transcriptional regulator [Actinosynnema sp. CS-041913]|uniref:winged helix-turn-helix transcriptional regulator n=1 Tax=Actinosynnema sp. CS-041913 TaxID=3239917 RepID=UPI003D900428
MTADDVPYRQSLHLAMTALSGQWVSAVLASLASGPLIFSDLLEQINAVEARSGWRTHERPLTRKVLTDTLARMQRDGLVLRSSRPEAAFQPVWYELSDMGSALLAALRPLIKWARQYQEELTAGSDRRRTSREGGAD